MNSLAGRSATTLPSFITMMRSEVFEDFTEEVRDEDAGAAAGDEAADEGEQLSGDDRIERRGGLVENDELHRLVGHGEGAGDLDHLAPGDRQVADDFAGIDAVSGEDLVELAEDEAPGLAASPTPEVRVQDPGILGDGEIGAQRQLLEDAAYAMALGDAPRS